MTAQGGIAVSAARWELVAAHRERLQKLVGGRLGQGADVEDCVNEALIRAATFERLDESRIGPFLTTTALRLCVDHQRDAARRQRLNLRSVAPPQESVEDTVCERAAASWLFRLARRLSPRERDVILARAQGMSTADAACMLGISHKSAESAFTRARSRLRMSYEHEMNVSSRALCGTG